VGLSAPLVSVAVWVVMLIVARTMEWRTSDIHFLITVGVWIPLVGMVVGFAGRPLLIIAIVPVSIGVVLFWWGSTVP
jgi:hypothetical protein